MGTKYKIDTEENKAFLKEIREELLRFGHRFPAPDGTCYYLGDDGTPWKEKNRDLYETCRMTHVYAIGEFLGHKGSRELVEAALDGLLGAARDRENGGWYTSMTPDGGHVENKLCYAHAFVILAASSATLAGHERGRELLKAALADYDRYFWNEEEGMSADTWNTDFTVLDPYRGINANMHTVEAFLAAADVTGDETYRVRSGRIIDRVIGWAKENDWRIPEHFSDRWEPDLACNKDHPDDQFKPYGATPGHGMEWARLILQWALSTYGSGEEMAPYLDAAKHLFRRAVADGWYCDGAPGIVYTIGWDGRPVVHDRMHWVLAEAINTSAILYHQTKERDYAEDYEAFMKYLDEKVLDHKNGSWFHQLDEKNEPKDTVWPGKPDLYHALQTTLIPYYAPELSIAVAVKEGKVR